MSTQIRGNKQIKNITIENDQIVNGTVELNKLKEGAELLKRDGSVPATNDLNLDGHQLKNIGTPVDGSDAVRKVDLDELAARVGGTLITREIVSGDKDGQNVTFTLSHEPTLATEQIFINGSLLNAGANADYSIQGNVITFTIAPQSGDVILANYVVEGVQLNVDVQATLAAFNGRLTTAEGELFQAEQAIVELGNDADILAGRVTNAEGDISALEVRATNIENNVDAVEANLSAEQVRAMAAESALAGRATSSENEIVGLKSRMTTAEGDINSLEAADAAMDSRVGTLEDGLQAETTARINAVNSLNTRVVALENDDTAVDGRLDVLESDVAALESDLAAEAAARLAADNNLQTNINAEIANRTAAVAAVQSNLNTEIAAINASVLAEATARASAISSVQLDLDIAIEDQVTGDTTLGLRIDGVESALSAEVLARQSADSTESSARSSADSALGLRIDGVQSDLADEVLARQNGDANLQSQIDSLSSGSGAGFEQIEAALSQEILDRQAGDSSTLSSANNYTDSKVAALVNSAPAVLDTLNELSNAIANDPNFAASLAGQVGDVQTNIDAEVLARQAADSALQTSINNEVSARQAAVSSEANTRASADNALQTNINNEASARSSADTALGLRIDGVQSTLDTEILNRGDSITAEISARQAADSAEAAARSSADTALGHRIDDVLSDLSNESSARQAADSSESAARASADSALGVRIDGIESSLNTEVVNRQTAITAEADARAVAINNVNVTINVETSNRTAAISAEATARQNADTALGLRVDAVDDRVDSVVADLAQEVLDRMADVDAEETRAMAAEAALVSRIDSLEGNGGNLIQIFAGLDYVDQQDTALSNRITTLENKPEPVFTLDGLSDVAVSSPSNGQVILYNGSEWVNAPAPSTFSGSYNDLTNKPNLATVATSGSYSDLLNKPTGLATETYVDNKVSALVNSAPATLDTLKELSDALGADANFSTTMTNALASKANISSLATVATTGSYNDLLNKPTLGSLSGSLDDLSDVTISSPANLEFLKYNGSAWVNASLPVASGSAAGVVDTGFQVFAGSKRFSGGIQIGYIESNYTPTLTLAGVTGGTTIGAQISLTGNTNDGSMSFATKETIYGSPITRASINTAGLFSIFYGASVSSGVAATKALVVKGAASQTADLLDIQNSSGTSLFTVNSSGSLSSGTVPVARVTGLATVATSGSYNDLSNKPTIPSLTGYATETYVDNKVAALVNSAPAALDTLNELATALGNDANFSTTMTNALAAKASTATVSAIDTRVTALESGAFVTREVPSGVVDGSNKVFVLANTPVAGSEQVFVNGMLQDSGATNDYTISGSTITFVDAPLSGWKVHVSYATGSYTVAPGGSSSGSSVSFFTSSEYSWSNSSTTTVTHSLGVQPKMINLFVKDGNNSIWQCPMYSNGVTGQKGWECYDITSSSLKVRLSQDFGWTGPVKWYVVVMG